MITTRSLALLAREYLVAAERYEKSDTPQDRHLARQAKKALADVLANLLDAPANADPYRQPFEGGVEK